MSQSGSQEKPPSAVGPQPANAGLAPARGTTGVDERPAGPNRRPDRDRGGVDLSIVIPVFNEEPGISSLVARLRKLCDRLRDVHGTRSEVVFIDDHSSDQSPALLASACAEDPRMRFLRLSRNRGSHIAILAGLAQCRGRCAVFLAADLQDPPELVVQMLDLWREGNHVVWAVRGERRGIPWHERLFAAAFYTIFNRLAHVTLPPQGSDFALLDRAVIDGLLASASASPFLMGEIAQIGYRQAQVSYVKEERRFGTTKWNLRKKLRLFADAFVSCSYVPLRAMSYLGIGFSVLGFLYALLVVALRLTAGTPVEGWASLMVAVLVLGGIQMTMLGVLGEYLWRTLEEARKRPAYFIERASDAELVRATAAADEVVLPAQGTMPAQPRPAAIDASQPAAANRAESVRRP